jgi:hypothetical protein
VVVAALGVLLSVLQWERAGQIAAVATALAAVAAVGVAVWAALPGAAARVRISNTGKATARKGGKATSGLVAAPNQRKEGLEVERTGDAEASDGGEATSGARLP